MTERELTCPADAPLRQQKKRCFACHPQPPLVAARKKVCRSSPLGQGQERYRFCSIFFHTFSSLSHFDLTSPRLKRADSISFQSFRCGGSSSSTEMRMADKTSKKLMAIAIIFTYRGNHAISHLHLLSFRKKRSFLSKSSLTEIQTVRTVG